MAEIWTNILEGFREIFTSPSRDYSILWIIIPIIFFWLTLEVYFGRYKDEKLPNRADQNRGSVPGVRL